MRLPRRQFLRMAGGAAAVPVLPQIAAALDYPARPVHAVIGYALPDMPSISETVPGYDVEGWIGLGAPSGTPADVIGKINRAFSDGLADPGLKQRLVGLGVVPTVMSPDEFGTCIAGVIDKLGGAIKFASIKAG